VTGSAWNHGLVPYFYLFFYTLGIKNPEGFGGKINIRNCQSDHYFRQSSRMNASWSRMLLYRSTKQKWAQIKKAVSRSSPDRWLFFDKTVRKRYYYYFFFTLGKYNPEGWHKLDRLQKILSWNVSLCLLINKTVVQQKIIIIIIVCFILCVKMQYLCFGCACRHIAARQNHKQCVRSASSSDLIQYCKQYASLSYWPVIDIRHWATAYAALYISAVKVCMWRLQMIWALM